MDVVLLAKLDETLLSEVRVVLDLESGGCDSGVAEEVEHESTVVVGNTNALGETLVNQFLHGLVCLGERGLGEGDLVVLVGPAGRVADAGVDILQGDGEVDDVQVEVVNAQVCELLLGNRLDLVGVVERVPELGDKEEVLTLDKSVLDGTGDTLADLLLVAVVAGTVEESVSNLDGVVDSVGASVVVDLPETEANERHLRWKSVSDEFVLHVTGILPRGRC